jgi:hypothetical protein
VTGGKAARSPPREDDRTGGSRQGDGVDHMRQCTVK